MVEIKCSDCGESIVPNDGKAARDHLRDKGLPILCQDCKAKWEAKA